MKIIKQGALPQPPRIWWTLVPIKCDHCKTIIQLDETDKPLTGGERHVGAMQWVEFACPFCMKTIHHIKPIMRTS